MSNRISPEVRQIVADRANFICEYCLIAEADSYYAFQVEHIISRKHDGSSELENLAFACVFCNRHKGSDIGSLAQKTGELVGFYNPRVDRWHDHFLLDNVRIQPISDRGEATIRILQMNHDDRILEREILVKLGRYPSEAAKMLITEH